jgi:manganese/zinc/iron transport system substrate-binding protein
MVVNAPVEAGAGLRRTPAWGAALQIRPIQATLLSDQKMFFDASKTPVNDRRPAMADRFRRAHHQPPRAPVHRVAALLPVVVAVTVGGMVATIAGCDAPAAGPAARAAGARPRVVATTTIVADLVRQIGGEWVDVDCLMAPGIDPHSYKATPRDAERIAAADLVVASGLHLEGRLADLLGRLGRRRPVLAVGDALPRDLVLTAGPDVADPHVWFDAALWARTAPVVADALARLDAAHAAAYHAAAAAYAARLESLHATLAARIAAIPVERRVLVTAHDAFRYFGRAYQLEVVAVQGLSTESEAGLGDINRLVDLLVSRAIPAVFVETSVSDRNVRALVEGAAARGHAVALGGRLYSDSLGGPGEADTLEAALTANVDTIVAALGAAAREP